MCCFSFKCDHNPIDRYCSLHFTAEEIEVQEGEITCLTHTTSNWWDWDQNHPSEASYPLTAAPVTKLVMKP